MKSFRTNLHLEGVWGGAGGITRAITARTRALHACFFMHTCVQSETPCKAAALVHMVVRGVLGKYATCALLPQAYILHFDADVRQRARLVDCASLSCTFSQQHTSPLTYVGRLALDVRVTTP